MKINEVVTKDNLRNAVKNKYPHLSEQQLDEIIPALAGAAAGVGRVGAQMGKGIAKAGAKAATGVAKKVGATAVKGAKGAGQKMAQKVGTKATDMMAKQMLKKGAKLPLPSEQGTKPTEFEIDGVKGDEVVLVNPKPKPGEPIKTVHSKKDLEPILKQMTGM